MKCQRCESENIVSISAKCPDMWNTRFKGEEGSVSVENVVKGEYIEPTFCANCGQIQGKFPVEVEFTPATPFSPPPETLSSAKEMFLQCRKHTCYNKEMVSCDNPEYMTIGYTCLGCGEWFGVTLPTMKETMDEMPDDVRKLLDSRAGRQKLGGMLSNGWKNKPVETENIDDDAKHGG